MTTVPLRTAHDATMSQADALRSWLMQYDCYAFDCTSKTSRTLSGARVNARGRTVRSTIVVPADVFHDLGGELVWTHHMRGDALPPGVLFSLAAKLPLDTLSPLRATPDEEIAATIAAGDLEDGEVLGLSPAGTVLQWNVETKEAYDCGEHIVDFGIHALCGREALRIGLPEDAPDRAKRHVRDPDGDGSFATLEDFGFHFEAPAPVAEIDPPSPAP